MTTLTTEAREELTKEIHSKIFAIIVMTQIQLMFARGDEDVKKIVDSLGEDSKQVAAEVIDLVLSLPASVVPTSAGATLN